MKVSLYFHNVMYFRVKADNKEEKGDNIELDFVFWN